MIETCFPSQLGAKHCKTLQDDLGNEISDIAAFVPPKPHNCTAKKKQGPKFKKS